MCVLLVHLDHVAILHTTSHRLTSSLPVCWFLPRELWGRLTLQHLLQKHHLDKPSDPETLGTDNMFQTINANNNWLQFPIVFVGAEKANHSPTPSPTGLEEDYQFSFIFLREKLITE